MRLLIALAATTLTAAAALPVLAEPPRNDSVRKDGDPVRVQPQPAPEVTRGTVRMYDLTDVDVAVARIGEPDRGGGVDDGDLWTSALSATAETGATATITITSNSLIPDTAANRALRSTLVVGWQAHGAERKLTAVSAAEPRGTRAVLRT